MEVPYVPRPRVLAPFILGLVVGLSIALAVTHFSTWSNPTTSTSIANTSLTSFANTTTSVKSVSSPLQTLSSQLSECPKIFVNRTIVLLPLPRIRNTSLPIELALAYRRSLREYLSEPISIYQLSQLLWAADGINEPVRKFRTAPSAGATYPIVIYVVVGERTVEICRGKYLAPGSYLYDPHTHSLKLVKFGDLRKQLAKAALGQEWVKNAAIDIVLCAIFERTTKYYGERGYRYVYMEAGHIGQNIYLEATALGLGTVAIGAFYDNRVQEIVGAKPNEHPIYIFPVGVPKTPYRVTQQAIDEYIVEHREARGLKVEG